MKKYLLPLGAGVVVFGVATAFAASLGVSSTSLGAGNTVVATCTDHVKVSYATSGGVVSDVTVKTYDASNVLSTTCDTKSGEVTLTDVNGASLGSVTASISTSTGTFNFTSANVDPAAVEGVSVTITG